MTLNAVSDPVRDRLGSAIFARIAGDEGPQRRDRIHYAPGPRRFGPGDPIQRVHGDAAMFVGGLRALVLQTLHPLAMAAVADHSGFRGDPWGRLARTSTFIAETTFGTEEQADEAVATVRAVHSHIHGVAPDGRPYQADDPHLLLWVHVAEIDSFLRAHDRYGAHRLTRSEQDTYVAQTAHVAEELGSESPPRTAAELTEALAEFRPELEATPAARSTARYVLFQPPLPWALLPGYGLLSSAALGLLPWWARWPLRLPWLPVTEATAGRVAGATATATIRWAMTPRAPSGEPAPAGSAAG